MAGKSQKVAPFLLFWVGVLTGAFIVTMVFLFRLYDPQVEEGEASLFRSYRTIPTYTQQLDKAIFPTTNLFPDSGGW